MRYLLAAADASATPRTECATGRLGAGHLCYTRTMGAHVFHYGGTSKESRPREYPCPAPVLVANSDGGVGFPRLKN